MRALDGAFTIEKSQGSAENIPRYTEVIVHFEEKCFVFRQWFTDEDQLDGFVTDLQRAGYQMGYFQICRSWTPWIREGCF